MWSQNDDKINYMHACVAHVSRMSSILSFLKANNVHYGLKWTVNNFHWNELNKNFWKLNHTSSEVLLPVFVTVALIVTFWPALTVVGSILRSEYLNVVYDLQNSSVQGSLCDFKKDIQSISKWKQRYSFKIAIGSVDHRIVCDIWNLVGILLYRCAFNLADCNQI